MSNAVDLKSLRAFVTVAREGNVTRAAEQLNLTQPAISLQLKRLANETGLELFKRTALGMELTHEGALLASKADQIFAALVDFNQTATNLGTQIRGKLRIGTIIDPEYTRLGALLTALMENGPGIETELRHGISGQVPERLRKDELDIGYFLGDIRDFALGPGQPAEQGEALYHTMKLAPLTYLVVAPPPLASVIKDQDWPALAELPWIGTPPASVHNRLLSRLFNQLGVRQNVVASVDQEASMLAMVRAGVGLSLCHESIALHEQQTNGLVIANKVVIETALSLICLNARKDTPAIKLAFDMAKRIWDQ
ncbi:MAG: LysR family transcriptional regulator [Rhodobacteraceae bacterium]|nr:LysR family transcriptional regulator [Paracoccaceae bacterium]